MQFDSKDPALHLRLSHDRDEPAFYKRCLSPRLVRGLILRSSGSSQNDDFVRCR